MRIHLVRHGQTPANVLGSLDTAIPGPGLTDLGHRQADAAAEVLQGQRANGQLAAIFVSNLQRTTLTAQPLSTRWEVEPAVLPGLREISAGDLELNTDDESARTYRRVVASWIHGDFGVRMPGGETGHEFMDRYDNAIEFAAGIGIDNAIIFSHGAAIRAWAGARAKDANAHEAAHEPLRNTGCITLVGSPGTGWDIEAWSCLPLGGPAVFGDTQHDPTGDAEPHSGA